MVKMVLLEPNPDYSKGMVGAASAKAKKDLAALKPIKVPYVTAVENIRNSKGLYRFGQEKEVVVPTSLSLEDRPIEELKAMLVTLGLKIEKKMKKADIITLIRRKLDEIEVVDDDEDSEGGEQAS